MSAQRKVGDVLVLGGGPAGLSLAFELGRRGIAATLLEGGSTPGWSWSRMPLNVHLLSPFKVNALAGTRIRPWEVHKLHRCHEYHRYLVDYAARHCLDVRCEQHVEAVARQPAGFRVRTRQGEFEAPIVVNATGYFSKPLWPRWPGMDSTRIRQIHVADYRSPAAVAQMLGTPRARILVVGRRISAGQTITELHDDPATSFQVMLSRRSPLEFAMPPWLQHVAFFGYYVYEDLRVLLDPLFEQDSYPPMESGRTRALVSSGAIQQLADIRCFHAEQVEFVDGTRRGCDLVIYATGFFPALDHLGDLVSTDANTGLPPIKDMESPETANLFFLGLDQQRSSRSRYLRGIREDAAYLAGLLDTRLRQLADATHPRFRSLLEEGRASVYRVGLAKTAVIALGRISDKAFDARYGLKTSERHELAELDIEASSRSQGQMYQPTGVMLFRRLLKRIVLPSPGVFVDYGCGKGRTLLLAAQRPFQRVVGIEFSKELCTAAHANAAAFQKHGQQLAPIEIIHRDAAHYEYRGDENIFYFFYPFGAELMRRVLAGIEGSLRQQPREAVLLYTYPIHRQVVDRSELFRLEQQLEVFGYPVLVYRHRPADGARPKAG